MQVIKHLKTYGLGGLDGLGISVVSYDDLHILNYKQIDSYKERFNPLVRECRGLVVDTDFNLVARSFPRFFNAEEGETVSFPCRMEEKLDGSLIIVFFHKEWRIHTKGSNGLGNINGQNLTWRSLVESVLDVSILDKSLTYVFELTSPFNRVVQQHTETSLSLLTIFKREKEYGAEYVDFLNETYQFGRPLWFDVPSMDFVRGYIEERVILDPRFEGVVLRDNEDNRVKVKSAAYLRFHRLANNGHVRFEDLCNACLDFETEELLIGVPWVAPDIRKIQFEIELIPMKLTWLWKQVKDIPNQKDFAVQVSPYFFSFIMFEARKTGIDPVEIFFSNDPYYRYKIIKMLDRKING